MGNCRDQSRLNWATSPRPSLNELELGCLQRIAAATEAMANNHVRLIRERDNYEAACEAQAEEIELQQRRIAALRGVITKLKRQIKET